MSVSGDETVGSRDGDEPARVGVSVSDARATVTIVNKLGMHARPAMSFVEAASGFKSDVHLRRTDGEFDEPVDGKSIMQLMMLAATKGTEIEIVASGEDAQEACDALRELVESGFDEG